MPILSKVSHIFKESPIKIIMTFFTEIDKTILKSVRNQKDPKNQSNLETGKKNWRHHTAWLQTILQNYYNQNYSTGIKTDMYIKGTEYRAQKQTHTFMVN